MFFARRLLALVSLAAALGAAAAGPDSGALETCFRRAAPPEELSIPLSLVGGKTTGRTYRDYVLLEASGEGRAGQEQLDSIWMLREDGSPGSYAGPLGLCL